MKTVEVRGLRIGEGIPKICASVMGITRRDIMMNAKEVVEHKVDIIEWRGDWYCDILKPEKVVSILTELRAIIGETPLLFTFRSIDEGGERKIHIREYVQLCKVVAESGQVDLLDVELYTGDHQVKEIMEVSQACGVKVIISNHDFKRTPSQEEIVERLCQMQAFEPDIIKIAVMPQDKRDVLTLLNAAEQMKSEYLNCPMCAISMGKIGAVTRTCGELFGSDITFGTVGRLSAPGQIEVKTLREIMQCLHDISEE